MRDITLGDTIYVDFTTRAFASGVPTVLAGSPVLSALEENNATPITAGVSVAVDRASVVGLNMGTLIASGTNGYENLKTYSVYISTGTVGGVSVVGEKVGEFSIGKTASPTNITSASGIALASTQSAYAPLKPTVAGRTLDVTATGEAGLDLDNTSGTLAAAQIATDAITADKIAANAITSSELADGAITAAKLGADAITEAKIADNALANEHFAAGALTSTEITSVAAMAGTITTLDALDTAQDLEHAITQDLVGNISSGSAALGQNATSVTATSVSQTLTYTATHEEDGTLHELAPSTGTLDFEYLTTLPDSASVTSVTLFCYVTTINDSVAFQFWDWTDSSFKTELTQAGAVGTTLIPLAIPAITAYTGTGANLGQVRFRVFSDGGAVVTNVAIDRLRFEYTVVQSALGFVGGAVWFDSVNGEAGTSTGIGSVARPSNTIADARTIADANNLKIIHSLPGSTMTLDQTYDDFELIGANWILVLNNKQISNTLVQNAKTITGIATGTEPKFMSCGFGAVTLPACSMIGCGFGKSAGQFTAGSLGEFVIKNGHSLVAGLDVPEFVFTGLGASTGINNRGWHGGATYTLDADCKLSHEVDEGGGTSITTGGATEVEVRGTIRSLTIVASAAEVVQFVGTTGPVAISGTTTATLNLYGISSSISDTSSAATVNDNTVRGPDLTAALADTNELQTDWANGGRLDLILDIIAADTTTDIPALIATAQADLDIITGATGVNLLAATQASIDAIEADTNELQGDWVNGGRLDLILDIIAADTTTDIPALIAALPTAVENRTEMDSNSVDLNSLLTELAKVPKSDSNVTWNATALASIESEVNDALDTAISELGVAAPTATPTLRTGMMLMYMALRNKLVVQTSGTDAIEIHNNAGTKIASKTITDDGSDYEEAKLS